jgi:hypothetical protein
MRKQAIGLSIICLLAVGCAAVPHAKKGPDHAQAEAEALKAVDAYMAGFNSRDAKTWAAALNYPHLRIATGVVQTWKTPDEYIKDQDYEKFMKETGWRRSTLDDRRVIQSSEDKVHVTALFTWYGEGDKKISTQETLLVVTKIAGRWGVQARSSFASH